MSLRELPPLPGVDAATAPDPDSPEYSAWVESTVFSPEGVDRMLIWDALHSTPTERLRRAQELANFAAACRAAHPVR